MSELIKDTVLRLDRAAPRYTSYPAATNFQSVFPSENYIKWLTDISASNRLSLYIHIPFCERLCYYCGCHTSIANSYDRIEIYINALKREISLIANILGDKCGSVSHLHFGGGSPTILSATTFNQLMCHIQKNFSLHQKAEIAIEADPRQMSKERVKAFSASGVTRISLGIQDFDQRVLAAVNRPQPFHLSANAVQLCRQYGIYQINVDLMYGLPGQTVKGIKSTIETALMLKPDRVSFFGYAHVPWMKKHMGIMNGMNLPDASLRFDLYRAGADLLKNAGYLAVGIDHFVRPTDSMAQALGNRHLFRNFQGYTTDDANALIGFGASAIGRFPQGYVQNTPDLRLYNEKVLAGQLPISKGLASTKDDIIHGQVISEIMCYMAVDLRQIKSQHELSENYFNECLTHMSDLLASGLVTCEDEFIRVLHPHLARLTARCFDTYSLRQTMAIGNLQRHSRSI